MLKTGIRSIALLFPLMLMTPQVLADVVVLATGERLRGTVVERRDDVLVMDHPVLGMLEIDASSVDRVVITDEPQPSQDGEEGTPPAGETAEQPEDEEEPEEDESPTPEEAAPEPAWSSRVELGFGFSEGNTQNKNLNLTFRTERDTDLNTTTFDAAYYFSEDDGETSENKATAGINQDWKVPDTRWLYFARARYDFDEFNSWETRVTAAGGVGYTFFDTEDFTFTARAGLGAAREFESDRDEVRLEGLIGGELEWQIDDTQSLAVESTYFPDFDETGEFRVLTDARWNLKLPQYKGANVFLGLRHEHQSLVSSDQKEDDIFIFGGLAIDF